MPVKFIDNWNYIAEIYISMYNKYIYEYDIFILYILIYLHIHVLNNLLSVSLTSILCSRVCGRTALAQLSGWSYLSSGRSCGAADSHCWRWGLSPARSCGWAQIPAPSDPSVTLGAGAVSWEAENPPRSQRFQTSLPFLSISSRSLWKGRSSWPLRLVDKRSFHACAERSWPASLMTSDAQESTPPHPQPAIIVWGWWPCPHGTEGSLSQKARWAGSYRSLCEKLVVSPGIGGCL